MFSYEHLMGVPSDVRSLSVHNYETLDSTFRAYISTASVFGSSSISSVIKAVEATNVKPVYRDTAEEVSSSESILLKRSDRIQSYKLTICDVSKERRNFAGLEIHPTGLPLRDDYWTTGTPSTRMQLSYGF